MEYNSAQGQIIWINLQKGKLWTSCTIIQNLGKTDWNRSKISESKLNQEDIVRNKNDDIEMVWTHKKWPIGEKNDEAESKRKREENENGVLQPLVETRDNLKTA